MPMKAASHYTISNRDTLTVRCELCHHNCLIQNHGRGLCKVRQNVDGTLYSLVYGQLVSENIDPVEKKPIFHLLPGSTSLSIATVGCNFKCRHCQNHQISQWPHNNPGQIPGRTTSPEQVVATAKQHGCASISYTYVEPTIFYEFAFDTARIAHQQGIKNIFVSNGYTAPGVTREIAPFLDANNIDLKAFTESFYRDICHAKLRPVLDTIQLMKELGVWVEVTTLIIPGLNDSDQELRSIAEFIHGVDPNMPWHVSRFHPTYEMTDRPPTPASTLHRAREIGAVAGLRHIYTGNIPGQGGEDTLCPNCQQTLIKRWGYQIQTNSLRHGACPFCGTAISGIWEDSRSLPPG